MTVGGLIASILGVDAEGRPLEEIVTPAVRHWSTAGLTSSRILPER